MDWDDPKARLALIENVGHAEYNRLLEQHIKQTVIKTVAGHNIRPISTRFGRLFQTGDGHAFYKLDKAEDYAKAHPMEKQHGHIPSN